MISHVGFLAAQFPVEQSSERSETASALLAYVLRGTERLVVSKLLVLPLLLLLLLLWLSKFAC